MDADWRSKHANCLLALPSVAVHDRTRTVCGVRWYVGLAVMWLMVDQQMACI